MVLFSSFSVGDIYDYRPVAEKQHHQILGFKAVSAVSVIARRTCVLRINENI